MNPDAAADLKDLSTTLESIEAVTNKLLHIRRFGTGVFEDLGCMRWPLCERKQEMLCSNVEIVPIFCERAHVLEDSLPILA